MIASHTETTSSVRDILQDERNKDYKYEALLHRKIKCTDWFIKKFDETVKQGDFMDSVVRQVKTDNFTE